MLEIEFTIGIGYVVDLIIVAIKSIIGNVTDVIYDVIEKASNENVIVVFMITNNEEFGANVNEMKFYCSVTNNFNAILTKINTTESITQETGTLFAIIDEFIITIDIIINFDLNPSDEVM